MNFAHKSRLKMLKKHFRMNSWNGYLARQEVELHVRVGHFRACPGEPSGLQVRGCGWPRLRKRKCSKNRHHICWAKINKRVHSSTPPHPHKSGNDIRTLYASHSLLCVANCTIPTYIVFLSNKFRLCVGKLTFFIKTLHTMYYVNRQR
jgi:hypothetical protein